MSTAELRLRISADDAASGALKGVTGSLHGLASAATAPLRAVGSLVSSLGQIGLAGTGISAVADIISGLTSGLVGDAIEAQKIAAATDAVIKSTKGVAGMTAEAVADLATELSKVTPFEDDAIQGAENLLLTFMSIGKDVFPEATEVILDMSQALGQDLKSSAIQLGKALQDPTNGITALRRVGVNFNDAQKDMIEQMVAAGDLMGAQKLILKELRTEFGGAAKAAGQTFAGKLAILNTQIGNVKEAIGGPLIGVLSSLLDWATPLITIFGERIPSAFEWLGRTWQDVMGYLDPGNKRDLMREWFGDFGPRIDEVVRAVKRFGAEVGRIFGNVRGTIESLHDNWVELGQVFEKEGLPGVASYLTDWLVEEWRKIDWGAIWRGARSLGESLVSSGLSIVSNVTTWLGNQWAAIKWSDIWSKVVGIGSSIASSVGSIVNDVSTWLGSQWAKINWADVWSKVSGVGSSIASSVSSIASDVGQWLGSQWAAINWTQVWQSVGAVATGLAAGLGSIYADVTTWLSEQWAKIDWAKVWASTQNVTTGLKEALTPAVSSLRDELGNIDWKTMRENLEPYSLALSTLGGILSVVTAAFVAARVAALAHAVALGIQTAATWAATAAQGALNAVMAANPLVRVAGVVIFLIGFLVTLYETNETVRRTVDELWAAMMTLGQKAGELGRQFSDTLTSAVKTFGNALMTGALKPINDFTDGIKDAIGWVTKLLDSIGKIPASIYVPELPKVALPEIPGFAAGGVVPGPLGQPTLAVVHGGEQITPPGRGGFVVNQTINISGAADPSAVSRAASDGVLAAARAMGLA